MIPIAPKKAHALPMTSAVLQAKRWNQWLTTSGGLPLLPFGLWPFSCFIGEPVQRKANRGLGYGRLPHWGGAWSVERWSVKTVGVIGIIQQESGVRSQGSGERGQGGRVRGRSWLRSVLSVSGVGRCWSSDWVAVEY